MRRPKREDEVKARDKAKAKLGEHPAWAKELREALPVVPQCLDYNPIK